MSSRSHLWFRRHGYDPAPKELFTSITMNAPIGRSMRTLKAQVRALYGVEFAHNGRQYCPEPVARSYYFCYGLEHFDFWKNRGEALPPGASLTAAMKAHLEPDFADALEAAHLLSGHRGVLVLLGYEMPTVAEERAA